MDEQEIKRRKIFRRPSDALRGLQREDGDKQGLDPDIYNEDTQTIRGVAVCTGTPVDYWWFKEIIDMDSLELDLFNDSAPVLYSHDSRDHIGVVLKNSAKVVDGVLRCDVRFSKNNDKARMIFRDYVDGIRTRLSVGAHIGEIVDEEDTEEETIRLLNCEPYEVSAVAMGADNNAGVDRGYNPDSPRNPKPDNPEPGEDGMSETDPNEHTFDFLYATRIARENKLPLEVLESWQKANLTRSEILEDVVNRQREAHEAAEKARAEEEQKRKNEEDTKRAKGKKRKVDPESLEEVAKRASLSDALSLVLARAEGKDYTPDGAYGEYFTERKDKMKRGGVPVAVAMMPRVKRAFTGGAASGAALVEPSVDSYIDPSLRTANLLDKLGVNRRTLDAGKENLPIVSGLTAVTYQANDNLDSIGETQPGTSAVTVEPHSCSAKVRVSRTLIKTSDVIDPLALTESEVARAFEEKATAVLFNGVAASNEPVGLDTRTGVGALTLGTAGQPTFAELLTGYTTVITALRDVGRIRTFAYVVTAAVWQHLRSTVQTAGDSTKIITTGDGFADGYFEGKPVFILEALPANGLYCGDFSGVEYVTWGDMEVRIDDLTPDGGGVDFRFFVENDYGIRRPNAFVEGSRA